MPARRYRSHPRHVARYREETRSLRTIRDFRDYLEGQSLSISEPLISAMDEMQSSIRIGRGWDREKLKRRHACGFLRRLTLEDSLDDGAVLIALRMRIEERAKKEHVPDLVFDLLTLLFEHELARRNT